MIIFYAITLHYDTKLVREMQLKHVVNLPCRVASVIWTTGNSNRPIGDRLASSTARLRVIVYGR